VIVLIHISDIHDLQNDAPVDLKVHELQVVDSVFRICSWQALGHLLPLLEVDQHHKAMFHLDSDGAERNLPSSAPVSNSTLQSSSASAAVVIGGTQDGDFQLASMIDCGTESCHCEKSEFDPELEICDELERVENRRRT